MIFFWYFQGLEKGCIENEFVNIETKTTKKEYFNFLLWRTDFLKSIYTPTKPSQKQKFYKKLKPYISTKTNLTLGGDFNMVKDLFLDRQGGNPNNTDIQGLNYLATISKFEVRWWLNKNSI